MFINKILWQSRRGRFIAPTADLSASDCPTILSISIIAPLQFDGGTQALGQRLHFLQLVELYHQETIEQRKGDK